jgi:transmembrane sensor
MNKRKNINWEMLAKYLDKEMNDQEMQLMQKLILSDDEYDRIISEVQKPWNILKKQKNMIEVNTDSAWEKLKNRIEQTQTGTTHEKNISFSSGRWSIPYYLRIAAILIVATGLSYLFYRTVIQPDRNLQNKLTINSGSDQSIESTLPDGSTVLLRARSRLQFEHQASGTREVVLTGEAYFDVSPNPDEPFIVVTDQALVEVIGTSFSVHVDDNNNQVKVLVESGHVLLTDRSNKKNSLVIESGYIGIVSRDGIKQVENQDINYLAWKTKMLVFRETRLEDVIHDLNHTFGTNIVYGDARMAGCRFTGTFYNQPVDTLLQVLKTAFNLELEYTRSQITLIGEGCE